MVGITRVSSYSVALFNRDSITQQQNLRHSLTTRLSSGRRFASLSEYGKDLSRLVGFQHSLARLQATKNALDVTESLLQRHDSVFVALDRIAENLLGELEPAREAIQADNQQKFLDWQTTELEPARNAQRSITELLNTRHGERFIFAGARYRTRPVVSLDIAPVPALTIAGRSLERWIEAWDATQLRDFHNETIPPLEADRFTPVEIVGNNFFLPAYDSDFDPAIPLRDAGNANQESWETHAVNFARVDIHSFGVSSNDPVFQRLIEAARVVRSLAEHDAEDIAAIPEDERQDVRNTAFERAQSLLESFRQKLRVVRNRTALVRGALAQRQEELGTEIAQIELRIDQIRDADTNRTAVEIAALNLQLQASFQAIAQQRTLTLLNYL